MWGTCHVPGCAKSLTGLRDFHQRFQICDDHIKAPRVIRNNRVERFCQQCSRFHAVHEFEGDRRSCRTQLERHNARRRKQRAAAAARSSAAAAAAGGPDARPARRQRVDGPATGDPASVEAAPNSPLEHDIMPAAVWMGAGAAVGSNAAVLREGVSAANSDSSWPVPHAAAPADRSAGAALEQPPPSHSSCCAHVADSAAPDGGPHRTQSSNSLLAQQPQPPLPGPVHTEDVRADTGLEACLRHAKASTLPPQQLPGAPDKPPEVGTAQAPSGLCPDGLADGDSSTVMIQQIFARPRVARALRSVLLPGALDPGGEMHGGKARALQGHPAAVLEAASMHLGCGTLPGGARSVLRISAKLWGCTPDSLPANLQDAVLSWVQAEAPALHGCIRPGCVFLTLDIGLRLDERRAATAAGALSLMDHLTKWCSCWRELRVALQVGTSLAISVPGEQPVAMHPDSPPLNSIMPNVTSVSPRVMLTDGDTPLRLTLCGAHLGRAVDGDGASAAVSLGPECVREAAWGRAAAAAAAAGGAAAAIGVVNCDCDLEADLRDPRPQSVSVIARCRCDDHLTLRTYAVPGASPDSTVEIEFQPPRVPAGAAEVVWIEVWSGTYLSPAVPVLVTPDVDLACSVEALLAKSQRLCTGGNRAAQDNYQAWEESLMLSLCKSGGHTG